MGCEATAKGMGFPVTSRPQVALYLSKDNQELIFLPKLISIPICTTPTSQF